MPWKKFKTSWFKPEKGEVLNKNVLKKDSTYFFDPPGEKRPCNDWVLIIEKVMDQQTNRSTTVTENGFQEKGKHILKINMSGSVN